MFIHSYFYAADKFMKKNKTVQADFIDSDGFLAIKGELFWKWRAMDTEKRNIDLSLRVLHTEIAALLDKHPDVKEALGHQAGLINQASLMQQQYSALIVEIGEHLQVDMQQVSIDDQTGRVFQHQPGDAPRAIRSKKRK